MLVCVDVGAKGYGHLKGSDACIFSVFLVISCKISARTAQTKEVDCFKNWSFQTS